MRRTTLAAGGVGLAILVAGGVVGIESLSLARRYRGFSFAPTSDLAGAFELAAGWALCLAGALALRNRGRRGFGVILASSGLAWFVGEWDNPGAWSALAFTAGLVFSTVCPVVVAHAVLRYPDRRLDAVESIALGLGYLATLVVGGLIPALSVDPARGGCFDCRGNLLLVRDAPVLFGRASRAAVYLGVVWAFLLVIVVGRRLLLSSPARRRIVAPVLVPAVVYLGVIGLAYVRSAGRERLLDEVRDRQLWFVQGGLIVLIAMGTAWEPIRLRRTRSAVARLVVEVAEMPEVGGLGQVLGAALGDESLRILYPLADGRVADRFGRLTQPDVDRCRTPLMRGDTTVAVLEHRPGLLDVDGVADEIADAARLALDNERLQVQRQVQLADLQASRARIVAAADAERRRLERDLHDGAQQKLVALALGLRLAQLRLPKGAPPATLARLHEAQAEATTALGELRVVARGLYPRELADEGLAAGLETLVESSPFAIELNSAISDRLPPAIEAAAYFAVSHCIGRREDTPASIAATRSGDVLLIDIETSSSGCELTAVRDRVEAVDGTVTSEPAARSGTRIRVELPCAS
jgi:signal transduction histidine kinase